VGVVKHPGLGAGAVHEVTRGTAGCGRMRRLASVAWIERLNAACRRRPFLAGPCPRDSTAEHPLCATSQTVALLLASVSDGVGGQ
jgi:hypothetical protein